MPKNIITTPEQKFSDELKKELKGAKSAKFAVGWFFISGLKELQDEIEELESLQILISPTTNRKTTETMLNAEKFSEAVNDILESQFYQTPEQKKDILENEARAFLEKAGRLTASKENAIFIAWLAQKLAEERIKIRIYTKEVFHAKVYLIHKKNESVVFTGSSNISISGFTTNTEVNVRLINEKQVEKLDKWFDEKWNSSKDCEFTSLAAEALKKSWALNKEVTPFLIYLRILHDIFSIDEDRESEKIEFNEDVPRLYSFQKDAVIDAYRRIQKYNGVFLADVPGLGKTYMGSALLAHLQEEGEKAIVICSPKLQEQWEQVLDEYNVNAKVISRDHNKIAEIINDERLMQRQVILIDEAHHFRNPETIAYKDLQIICEGKKVILVGATPQNLKLHDMYFQIKLFHPHEMTEKLRIDPPELKKFFDLADEERKQLDAEEKFHIPDRSENLFQQILVRRTRKNIIEEYGKENLPDFPKRCGPYRIDYNIDKVYPGGIFNALDSKIDELEFARYDIGSFIDSGEFTDEEKQRLRIAGKNLSSIMRMILFKLLESSVVALRETLLLMTRSHELFLRGLDEGKVLAGDAADKAYFQLKDDIDIEEIDIPNDTYDAKGFKTDALRRAITNDLERLKIMHGMVEGITAQQDEKIQTLIKRIKGDYIQPGWDDIGKEKCEGKKILIFTQYATTAKYLGEELKKHFNRVDYVSGLSGGILEKAALFSPKTESNRKYLKKRGIELTNQNEIDILVSTEVLGEGINLQDGQVVINYELHWNPVRIIQRVGRIDRIGSTNKRIWVYNFFPQIEADLRININDRIKRRAQEIQTRFGGDDKVISQDEILIEKKFYEMYTEDIRALEEEEIESLSQKLKINWRILKDKYPEEYKKATLLPNMANCGLSNEKKGVAVYCRANDIYKLYLSDLHGKLINENDWEILSLLDCDYKSTAAPIYDGHFDVAEKIRLAFQDRANEIQISRIGYLELLKKQALERIDRAKRNQNEETKIWMSEVQGLVRSVKLNVKISRDLRGIIRQKHGLTPNEMVEKIEMLLKDKPKVEQQQIKKIYSEIVLSESLI